ncbi:nucleotidyltransferase domain-containing protein [Paraclostridium bifermentans]|uniref:nucleotidyltransferase domain-containing protein n=1 Tax=Paraclostridium bifermentans TaxID=1490 RepID=UPI00374F8254
MSRGLQYYKYRNIPSDVKDKILNVLVNENIMAILLYGSYGTEKQKESSDLDIALLTYNKLSLVDLTKLRLKLEKELDIIVDLKQIYSNSNIVMKLNMLSGELLYSSKDYIDYIANFYHENCDMIDIVVIHSGKGEEYRW